MAEEPLGGGHAGGDVVRVGGTVRKAATPATSAVFAYMRHLRSAGIDLPEPLGIDSKGRQVLEYVPGALALHDPPLSLDALTRVGRMVRAIHDASANFAEPADARWSSAIAAPGAELVCHNDLAPWNLIRGERWVFIDWDAAAPSTRLWDLAYAAQSFTLNDPSSDPGVAAARLAAFVAGYDADAELRAALPDAMAERTEAMLTLLLDAQATGEEPWATMARTGHAAHWEAASAFVRRHRDEWVLVLGSARFTLNTTDTGHLGPFDCDDFYSDGDR